MGTKVVEIWQMAYIFCQMADMKRERVSISEHARKAGQEAAKYPVSRGASETARVREGLAVEEFYGLREDLGVSVPDLEKTLSIAHRTLLRRKEVGRLQMEESDRLHRLRRLFDQAVGVFENAEDARAWMTSSQIGLGGESPLEYSDTDAGAREVEYLLGRIDHGVFS